MPHQFWRVQNNSAVHHFERRRPDSQVRFECREVRQCTKPPGKEEVVRAGDGGNKTNLRPGPQDSRRTLRIEHWNPSREQYPDRPPRRESRQFTTQQGALRQGAAQPSTRSRGADLEFMSQFGHRHARSASENVDHGDRCPVQRMSAAERRRHPGFTQRPNTGRFESAQPPTASLGEYPGDRMYHDVGHPVLKLQIVEYVSSQRICADKQRFRHDCATTRVNVHAHHMRVRHEFVDDPFA